MAACPSRLLSSASHNEEGGTTNETSLTKEISRQLLRNRRISASLAAEGRAADFIPVVKLFTPDANSTWLLTEIDPGDTDIAFGLFDTGLGFPEPGYVSLSELQSIRGRLGLPVERDRYFTACHTLSVYACAARRAGTITDNPQALSQAAAERAARGVS